MLKIENLHATVADKPTLKGLSVRAAAALFLAASAYAPLAAHGAPAASVAADPFASMRAVVAPALACERKFDTERRALADEQRRIDAMPADSAADQQKWHDAWAARDAKDRAFRERRGQVCETEAAFDQLKTHLAKLRPDLSPGEVHIFALGFFHDLRRTAEYAADFGAGYNARQYTPPPPPPAPGVNNGN